MFDWFLSTEKRIATLEEERLLGLADADASPAHHVDPSQKLADPEVAQEPEEIIKEDVGAGMERPGGESEPGALAALWTEVASIGTFPRLFWLVAASAVLPFLSLMVAWRLTRGVPLCVCVCVLIRC